MHFTADTGDIPLKQTVQFADYSTHLCSLIIGHASGEFDPSRGALEKPGCCWMFQRLYPRETLPFGKEEIAARENFQPATLMNCIA